MLACLSRHGARWLDLRVEHAVSSYEGEDAFSMDLTLSSSLLQPKFSWSRVKAVCEMSVVPAYKSLKSVLEEDIEHVSRLLAELDPLSQEKTEEQVQETASSSSPDVSPCSISEPALTSETCHSLDSMNPEQPKRKRRRSSILQEPIVFLPSGPSTPTIIITPCLSQPRETSCWVAIQDAAFGSRLTVPAHAVLNSVHPPMVPPPTTVRTRIDDWEYANGHWTAIIPPPDEQCRRGMFSRTAIPRRKTRRPPSRMDDSYL